MVSYWRAAGISYIRYSGLISQCIRRSTKPDVYSKIAPQRNRHALIVDKFTPDNPNGVRGWFH